MTDLDKKEEFDVRFTPDGYGVWMSSNWDTTIRDNYVLPRRSLEKPLENDEGTVPGDVHLCHQNREGESVNGYKSKFDDLLFDAWAAAHYLYCPGGSFDCGIEDVREEFEDWRKKYSGLTGEETTG